MDFNWINELLEKLPETIKVRKNFIEIAGYPTWENVNSNLLAFYLDEKEEHNFGRLFLNSLLDLYEAKLSSKRKFQRELFETEFSIEREVRTDTDKRIDLLVSENIEESGLENTNKESETPSWAIIIENKIYSGLHNDLSDYWTSTQAVTKMGIVLSVHPINILENFKGNGDIIYLNILHKELIEKIQQNLSEFYLDSDDRHLLFLKEYIANINALYMSDSDKQDMDEKLKLFSKNKNEIAEFKKVDIELLRYVSQEVFRVMKEKGYVPGSQKNSSKAKFFYIDKSHKTDNEVKNLEKFRFWIYIEQLKYNEFIANFELYGENTKYGDALKERLKKHKITNENVEMGSGGKSGGQHQHIYQLKIPIGDFSEEGFYARLKKVLENEFFGKKYLEKNYIELAVEELEKVIEDEKVQNHQ